MKPVELIGSLRAIELRLSTSEVNVFFRSQDDAMRQRFIQLSLQVSIAVSRVTTTQLDAIAAQLNAIASKLQAGITSLQSSIIQLTDASAIVNTLTSVLNLVGQILPLV
ncbi:MAG: hypothetical protein JWL77_1541 [Chthonomonadaceae bacterium]|nr:hypothetical protein [Chthonomonadaceae bacterium]